MSLRLLIVVLHYRGRADTFECLDSLAGQAGEEVRVLVVDNGSVEPLGPALAADYPWVELLVLAENRGWSGGNNAGIELALARGAEAVCLLNNDTVLPPGAVARLLGTMAALGPCILHPAIDSYGDDPQVQLDPRIPEPAHMTAMAVPGLPDVFEISDVSGACLLVHRAVFEVVGLIDERFFLLCEDVDLGMRAMWAGFHLYCDAGVRIQHKESRSFGARRNPLKTYYAARNMLLLYEKDAGIRRNYRQMIRAFTWLAAGEAAAAGVRPGSWPRIVRWSLSAHPAARALRYGLRDYARHRFGRLDPRDARRLG